MSLISCYVRLLHIEFYCEYVKVDIIIVVLANGVNFLTSKGYIINLFTNLSISSLKIIDSCLISCRTLNFIHNELCNDLGGVPRCTIAASTGGGCWEEHKCTINVLNEVVNCICYVCSTLVKYSNRTVNSYSVFLPSLAVCSSSLLQLSFSTSQS